MSALVTVALRREEDVVLARQRARDVARLLGFDAQEQTRFSTAVSEIARNAFRYANDGRLELTVQDNHLVARVTDTGPGIASLESVLDGTYRSSTGMGMGIVGARRLTDRFEITSAPGGPTCVVLQRALPRDAPPVTAATLDGVVRELARVTPRDPVAELQVQNQELMRTLAELRDRQVEIERLNGELEETNRGVLALYAELDDTAKHLRRASEQKSSFLSNVSHELRTPLTSILNLSRLMLDYSAAGLNDEHRRQLGFIRSSAQALADIVNDLLDLAKIEAGRVDVRPSRVSLIELFGTLRGMFRPLVPNEAVALVFDDPPPLHVVTDEGKLAQILRNFVSNALKYTDTGEVRVHVEPLGDAMMTFAVSDTGVGIPPEYHERIFDEFVQVEGPHQRRVKGTGLGLPLSRKLARLLGGTITVSSTMGSGSTFVLTMPRELPHAPHEVPT